MKKKSIFYPLLLFPVFLFSQQEDETLNKKADSIFFDAVTRVAPSDIERAHQIADSMYLYSRSDLHKVRALFLSSWFYNTSGFSEESVKMALKAEKLAVKSKNYEWQFRILGFLSSQFQNIGLLKEREELLQRMEETILKVKDPDSRALLYPMYYHEQTLYAIDRKEGEQAMETVKIAKEYMNKLPDAKNKYILLSVNERVHGVIFLQFRQQPDSALAHLEKAAFFAKQAEAGDYEKDFLYAALGQAYLMKNQDSLGFDYMKKAEILTEFSANTKLRLEVYEVLSTYYKRKNDTEKYALYLEKHKDLHQSVQEKKVKPVELLLGNLKNENEKLKQNRMMLSVISLVLVLGIIWSYIRYRNKRKKEYQKFQAIIERLKQNHKIAFQELHLLKEEEPEKNDEEKPNKLQIPEETEQKIIEGLQQFENGTHFLTANFALADLASEVGINIKYLSYMLKKHYGKDFSTYINELRINYIIEKLRANKEYRLYKLSFLAGECGFSSHSKFSAVFKSVVGITPTKFIDYLKKETG